MRDFLGHLLLRYPGMAQQLRRLPVLGRAFHWTGRWLIPPGTRVWTQVVRGPAAGLWLRLDPRYESEYVTGTHEPRLQQLLQDCLKPGAVFYDVGAHIGFFSLLAARVVGSEGSVFSFEAVAENAKCLLENASRNGLCQITVVPAAVWNECGQLRFQHASRASSRNTGRVASGEVAPSESVELAAITLDSFAEKHPSPQVIKIDVEGAEAEVLEGASHILAQSRPLVICEVHDPLSATKVESLLNQFGYQSQWLEPAAPYPRHLLACS